MTGKRQKWIIALIGWEGHVVTLMCAHAWSYDRRPYWALLQQLHRPRYRYAYLSLSVRYNWSVTSIIICILVGQYHARLMTSRPFRCIATVFWSIIWTSVAYSGWFESVTNIDFRRCKWRHELLLCITLHREWYTGQFLSVIGYYLIIPIILSL